MLIIFISFLSTAKSFPSRSMVVPYTSGELVRSLVRVPGSGTDKNAYPCVLDLSNVSPLAASVPIPRSIPNALIKHYKRETPPAPSDESANASYPSDVSADRTPTNVNTKKRQREESESLTLKAKIMKSDISSLTQTPVQLRSLPTNIPIQAGKVVILSPVQIKGHPATQKVQVVGQTQQDFPMSGIHNIAMKTGESATVHQVKEGAFATSELLSSGSTRSLIQELMDLKKENQKLSECRQRYRNIFQDKASLQYVVNRIIEAK